MSNCVEPIVRELVERIEVEWRAASYAHSAFPEIAGKTLEAVAPHRVNARELLASIAAGDGQQTYVGVHGSPQIVPVYWNPKFSISLHAWPDEVGTPHCHAWCGAYQVLEGTSISGSYRFDTAVRLDGKLAFGHLERTRLELLRSGATVAVHRGESMIHGLGYLGRLGISMSIRSNENPASLTYEYFAPGVRIEGTNVDQSVIDTIQCVRALALVDATRAADTLARALRECDLRTTFLLMRGATLQLRGQLDVDSLMRTASMRFGAHAAIVRAGLDVAELEATIRIRRQHLVKPEHRALLGILHLATTREDVERLVCEHFPGEAPRSFVKNAIVEMATTPTGKGTTLLGTPAGSNFDAVLEHLIDDPRAEHVIAALGSTYDAESIRKAEPMLRRACASLQTIPLLKPLFARAS